MAETNEDKAQKNILQTLADNEKPISNLIDKLNNTIENISNQFLRHKKVI